MEEDAYFLMKSTFSCLAFVMYQDERLMVNLYPVKIKFLLLVE